MQAQTYIADLERALSPERLAPYHGPGHLPITEALANYFWNVALCEALYPSFHIVEVTLRNTLHQALTTAYGTPNWFALHAPVLLAPENAALMASRRRLVTDGRIPTPGDVIASLDFGFWTSLFRRSYESILWRRPGLLADAFPHLPRGRNPRARLAQRFNEIRRFRNRVFHHEPIWQRTDLPRQHAAIREAIGWMSPAMQLTLTTPGFDQFPQVHALGSTHYWHLVIALLATLPPSENSASGVKP